jgi:4-carboxymuconolactone decarboxylase
VPVCRQAARHGIACICHSRRNAIALLPIVALGRATNTFADPGAANKSEITEKEYSFNATVPGNSSIIRFSFNIFNTMTRLLRGALYTGAALMNLLIPQLTQAADRLPTIPVEQYSAEQKQAVTQYEAVRKAPIFGPFEVMLYSPAMMTNAREVGDYMKAGSAIPRNLAELAVLYIAKDWNQDYVWHQHVPLALKAGLPQSHVDALGYGQKPTNMNDDEDAVYAFVNELVRNHQVADQTFDRVNRRFGSKGVVDLTSLTAFYLHLSMQLNVAKFKLPAGAAGIPRRAEATKP